jgi:DNA-binding NarL/FixJ family response regulator
MINPRTFKAMQILLIEPEPCLAREFAALDQDLQVRTGKYSDPPSLARSRDADAVLIGAQFLPMQMLEMVRAFKTQTAKPIVVVAEERDDVLLPVLEAGASGYVRPDSKPAEMLSTLQNIMQGRPYFAPAIGTALVERMNELLELKHAHLQATNPSIVLEQVNLSGREMEILDLLSKGASNQVIAERLVIEVGTVKNHVHNILKKLGVSNRAQAAQYYMLMQARGTVPNGREN